MAKVKSIALDQTIEVDRLIGRAEGSADGPCLVFFAGIHGNEPSGIFALKQVFEELAQGQIPFRGRIIGISGNLWALERGERFQEADLNRLWDEQSTQALEAGTFEPKHEDHVQQQDIFEHLQAILNNEEGPFYFLDLHTTSGDTIPFITVNDSLLNRKFTQQYPVPLILGIEEHLDGPLLSYINELGYVSFGFEGGQHDSIAAIENHRTFIWLSLLFSGAILSEDFPHYHLLEEWQEKYKTHQNFYEIYFRHKIEPSDTFVMKPGFANFTKLSRGQVLAKMNDQEVTAKSNTTLFMPLYQAKGSDGFFLVKKTPRFFLWLSGLLRRGRIDRIFPWFPGVNWTSKKRDAMLINLLIARFIAKPLFHLFGYRSKEIDQNHLLVKNREYRSRTADYQGTEWYK